MLDLLGEARFHYMDLCGDGIQHLLYACPNALETLKLSAYDICGEKYSLEDIQTLVNDFPTISQPGSVGILTCLEIGLSANSKSRPIPSAAY